MTTEFPPLEELTKNGAKTPRPSLFGPLRQILFQPTPAFQTLLAQNRKGSWLVPVVLIGLLLLIAVLLALYNPSRATAAASAISARATQSGAQRSATTTGRQQGGQTGGNAQPQGGQFPGGGLPPDIPQGAVIAGGPGGPGGVGAFPGAPTTTGTSAAAAATPNLWLSLGAALGGFVVVWVLTGVLTNLFSLAFGGRSGAGTALMIAAWASIPLGIRSLMHIFYYLATSTTVQMPGLSGFITTTTGNNLLLFAQLLLSQIDIYLFWQVILLAVGVGVWGGLSRKKAALIAVLSIVVVLLLQAGLTLGLDLLGNMNFNAGTLLRLR